MSFFRVDLKKIIDDSYDIEIGYELSEKLIEDIKDSCCFLCDDV
jgi:3-dehydroquinate synthase